MTKETLEKILEKNKRIYNKRNHIDGIRGLPAEHRFADPAERGAHAAALRRLNQNNSDQQQ